MKPLAWIRRQSRRLALTAVTLAAFVFFWVNGPLQEPEPVFEFEEHIAGFDEPVLVGREQAAARFSVVQAPDDHPHFRILTPRERPARTYGIIADARHNPAMAREVGQRVLQTASDFAIDPAKQTLKNALDLFYVQERDPSGQISQLYLENTGLNKHIKGYAGPIDIGLLVGRDGRIRRLVHLRSAETTSYLKRIDDAGFYRQFEAIDIDGSAYRVDMVTGATLTTEAIAKSLNSLVGTARESPLSLYLDEDPLGFHVRAVMPNTWVIDAALIALLFLLVWMQVTRRSKRAMLALTILSILALGFWQNNSFTYVTFLLPFLGSGWSWVLGIYAALVLLSAIWDGNSYCRYVCPYGNLQRLLLRWAPWRNRGRPVRVSGRLLHGLRWLITITLVVGIVLGLREWRSFELFPDLFGLELLDSPWFWLSLGVILLSSYVPMLWCRALCPTGAVLDGLADLGRPRRSAAASPAGAKPVAAAAA